MSDTSVLLDKWLELKTLVESLEVDVRKNAGGNASAGVRARKGLRALRGVVQGLVKVSLESSKTAKQQEPSVQA